MPARAYLFRDVFHTEQTRGGGFVYSTAVRVVQLGGTVETEYDVFEVLVNRSVKWQFCVREKQLALDMMKALGTRTFNECFATNLGTQEIIGRVNCGDNAAQAVIEDYKSPAN